MQLISLMKQMQDQSSEGLAAYIPHDLELGRFEIFPVCTCENCGKLTVLDDTSIPFEAGEGTSDKVKALMAKANITELTDKPEYIYYSDEFGGALCESCHPEC